MKNITEYLYYYKITKNDQKNNSGLELINNYQITNQCYININKFRQYQRTKDETITVGLELTNQQGKLIRFVPRNITIITKQG